MVSDAVWIALGVAVLLCVYFTRLNWSLSSIPNEVTALSPTRFDVASVQATYERILKNPVCVDLPPKTGRKYIVVGGAGFLPGWIVVQLLTRGEDPKRIRVVDIRSPMRADLTASAVAFFETDVSNADAVMAAFTAPWPDAEDVPITVFHSAANIRFWERAAFLLPHSIRINLHGTQNVLAASLKIGASTLVYTSSASIALRRARFWIWPWQRYPKGFFQVLDDDAQIPTRHNQFFSNYAMSKALAERAVRLGDKTRNSRGGVLRTGCIRPGNGIYGPGGDAITGIYLVRKINPTSVKNIIQSFVYVENCALAHLLYEQRLIEMDQSEELPDIGGQAFNVADPNPPISFGDIYTVLTILTRGEVKFPTVPPALTLALAHAVEAYYVLRERYPLLARNLPRVGAKLLVAQPSTFSLIQVHLVFDDSRACKSPKEGGLGFKAPYTSLEALCNMLIEYNKEGKLENERLAVGGRMSYDFGVETNFVKK